MGQNGEAGESFETCGWREELILAPDEKKVTGAAKRPLKLEITTLKFDTHYSLLTSFMFMEMSAEDEEPINYSAHNDMMLMEGSGAVKSLITTATALIALSLF